MLSSHLLGPCRVQQADEACAPLAAASCLSPPCSRSPGSPGSTSTPAPSPFCMKSYTQAESGSDIWKQTGTLVWLHAVLLTRTGARAMTQWPICRCRISQFRRGSPRPTQQSITELTQEEKRGKGASFWQKSSVSSLDAQENLTHPSHDATNYSCSCPETAKINKCTHNTNQNFQQQNQQSAAMFLSLTD